MMKCLVCGCEETTFDCTRVTMKNEEELIEGWDEYTCPLCRSRTEFKWIATKVLTGESQVDPYEPSG